MDSQQQFTITQSGILITLSNALQNTTSIEFDYMINGTPLTMSLIVQGMKKDGTVIILDTYTGTTNAKRTITLTDTYDSFVIVPNWTGGANVSVGVTIITAGPGPSFQGAFQQVRNGVGSPVGVLAAPVGTVYVSLSGGSNVTLWVKESGTGTSGWA